MEATQFATIVIKHDKVNISTQELADNLEQLQRRGNGLDRFRVIEGQEKQVLAKLFVHAANEIDNSKQYHLVKAPNGTKQIISSLGLSVNEVVQGILGGLDGVKTNHYAGLSLQLTHAIRAFQILQSLVESAEKESTQQTRDCTELFCDISVNKKSLEELGKEIEVAENQTNASIEQTEKTYEIAQKWLPIYKISASTHKMEYDEALRKAERWHKASISIVYLQRLLLIQFKQIHKWTRPLIVTYPVTKLIEISKEVYVDIASEGKEEAERRVESALKSHDELSRLLSGLRSIAKHSRALLDSNDTLYKQSERMMQDSKTLQAKAERMRGCSMQAIRLLKHLEDELKSLPYKTDDGLEQEEPEVRRLLNGIESLFGDRELSGTVSTELIDRPRFRKHKALPV